MKRKREIKVQRKRVIKVQRKIEKSKLEKLKKKSFLEHDVNSWSKTWAFLDFFCSSVPADEPKGSPHFSVSQVLCRKC